MSTLEEQELESLDMQSDFYIKLHEILTWDKSKISMTDWYDFVIKNKSIYEQYSLLTLISTFETSDSKKYKEVLKLLNDSKFLTYIQAITMQIVKDNKLEYSQTINSERQSYKKKVDEVISLTTQQEIIVKKARQLEESIWILEIEIDEYKVIAKKQSKNLEQNIFTIEKLTEKEDLLKQALEQSHNLIKEAKKLWIFVEVNNSRWELRLNSTAVDATSNQTIHSYKPKESLGRFESTSSKIIKSWDKTIVEPFTLKEIPDTKKSENFEIETDNQEQTSMVSEYDAEDIKKMMDTIYYLEEQSKIDSKKIIKLGDSTEKQSKKLEKIKLENKKLKEENDTLKKTVIKAGWWMIVEKKEED